MNTRNRAKEKVEEIQATVPTQEELQWIDFQLREKQDTLKRLEETAKFLSGLSTLSLALLAGPNSEEFKAVSNLLLIKIGIISWLASIVFTLIVLFPFRYKYARNSASSIKKVHTRVVGVKYAMLIVAAAFYLIGIWITVYFYLFS